MLSAKKNLEKEKAINPFEKLTRGLNVGVQLKSDFNDEEVV